MYIINYKGLDKGLCSCLSISKNEKEGYYSAFEGDGFSKCNSLIPDKDFEGKIESEEQVREYIRNYYINVLSKLDPEKIYRELEGKTLVTFDDGEFSHGYIVAAWFELFLDTEVKCVEKIEFYKKLKDVKPKWVVDVLEEEIKKTIDNMRGFNSVRALYLFNRSEEQEKIANELENKLLNDKSLSGEEFYKLNDRVCGYRQEACFTRCDADMAEDAWRERRYKLVEEAKTRSKKREA